MQLSEWKNFTAFYFEYKRDELRRQLWDINHNIIFNVRNVNIYINYNFTYHVLIKSLCVGH